MYNIGDILIKRNCRGYCITYQIIKKVIFGIEVLYNIQCIRLPNNIIYNISEDSLSEFYKLV